jgi:hypothetical protein
VVSVEQNPEVRWDRARPDVAEAREDALRQFRDDGSYSRRNDGAAKTFIPLRNFSSTL